MLPAVDPVRRISSRSCPSSRKSIRSLASCWNREALTMPSTSVPDPCSHGDDGQDQEPQPDRQLLGIPDPATVLSDETFISPKGREYHILRTSQTDEEPADDDDSASGKKQPRVRKRPPTKPS